MAESMANSSLPEADFTRADFSPALQRVIDASQRVVLDRVELMRVDVSLQLRRTARTAVLGSLAAVFLFTGWVVLVGAGIAAFDALSLPLRLAVASAVHLVIGGACLLAARRK
jgi:hypothetical protein